MHSCCCCLLQRGLPWLPTQPRLIRIFLHCPTCGAVLLGSSFLEAYSLRVAFQSIQLSAEEQGMGLWQYIKRGRDPTTVAILWEDGGAVAGLGLAGGPKTILALSMPAPACSTPHSYMATSLTLCPSALSRYAGGFTLLTYFTGQPHWDAMGSIAVGLLMGVIALQLMRTNKRFLIGAFSRQSAMRVLRLAGHHLQMALLCSLAAALLMVFDCVGVCRPSNGACSGAQHRGSLEE